jgi:predicted naringenin-chalcone synthase
LGIQAIEQALQAAKFNPADVDNLIVVSCTGVDTPGLDVRIAEVMEMSPYLRRATLVGMGCQALLPALYQAQNIVLAEPQNNVVILTLELCTLHFQHGKTLKNILGSALFADGASAVVVGNSVRPGPRLLDSLTYCDYRTQEELSFRPGDTGYQISLTGRIPGLLAAQVPPLVDRILGIHNLKRQDIVHWAVHPGGLRILDCVEAALGLRQSQFDHARATFRRYGNMSSATLLFVLNRIIEQDKPAEGDHGLLIGFGPGLTIEIGLVQW